MYPTHTVMSLINKINFDKLENSYISNFHYLTKFGATPPSHDINVCKISIHDNLADMMTKSVHIAKFELFSSLVGIMV